MAIGSGHPEGHLVHLVEFQQNSIQLSSNTELFPHVQNWEQHCKRYLLSSTDTWARKNDYSAFTGLKINQFQVTHYKKSP